MSTKPAPYHFVPVEPDAAALDAPVLHDSLPCSADSWTGELLCTLTTLTPLLAANDQFEFRHAVPAVKRAFARMAGEQLGSTVTEDDKLGGKKILEPLFAPNGAVLIGGAALKGMVRSGLSALLSAPMERVAVEPLPQQFS